MKMHRLTQTQKAMLSEAFGTYETRNNGRLLNREAYHWISLNFSKTAVIDPGDAAMPTTVRFTKKPYFTYSQIKELKETKK